MVAGGIDASRLTTKGYGESKPFGTMIFLKVNHEQKG